MLRVTHTELESRNGSDQAGATRGCGGNAAVSPRRTFVALGSSGRLTESCAHSTAEWPRTRAAWIAIAAHVGRTATAAASWRPLTPCRIGTAAAGPGTSASAWRDWEVLGSDSCFERRCTDGRVGEEVVDRPLAVASGVRFDCSSPELRLQRRRGGGRRSVAVWRSEEIREERESREVCEKVVTRPPRQRRVLCLPPLPASGGMLLCRQSRQLSEHRGRDLGTARWGYCM